VSLEWLEPDKDTVDHIIELCNEPVKGKKTKPVDLEPCRKSLTNLLIEVWEVYRTALDDWEARNDPKIYQSIVDEAQSGDDPGYDYGDMADLGFPENFDPYKEWFSRGRGNPGTGRANRGKGPSTGVAVRPLHPVYSLAKSWWIQAAKQEGFKPDFVRPTEDEIREDAYDWRYYNPSARFLLKIAQFCDERFTPDNCVSAYDQSRKIRSSGQKQVQA